MVFYLFVGHAYTYMHTHMHVFYKCVCIFACMFVQSPSLVWLFTTPWTAAHQASLSRTISWNLPRFMFIASVMPSSHLILWHRLLLPSIFPSIRDFSNEASVYIRWPKYWNFSISPLSEYLGFISLKTDWFDLFAVPGTFRSLFQHHSSKTSILWCSAFFIIQLSQLYMPIALVIWTFPGIVMSLLFNTLPAFVITFLPRSNCLLISCCNHCPQWFWSPRRGNLSLLPLFPLLFAMQ